MEVCKVTPSTGKGYPQFVQQKEIENGQNEPVGRPAALPEVAQHMHHPKNPHRLRDPDKPACSNRVLNKKVKDGLKSEESVAWDSTSEPGIDLLAVAFTRTRRRLCAKGRGLIT